MPKGRAIEADSTIRYEYVIKDHLGNSRIVFSDLNGNGKVDAMAGPTNEILHEGHYYPFGLEMTGPWSLSDNPDVYDNRFNGKERMQRYGLNYHDFGARWYDAEIGRWLSVDPKAADAPGWSPYRAFFCNPIRYTDPDGQWEWDAKGNLVAQKGDNSYSMAKFLGTSQSNAMQMLERGGVTANSKGVLNLKEGQSFAKDILWVGTKSASGRVVNSSKEATSHYYNGNGAAVDVGDQATTQLLSSDKFDAKHTKITSEQVQPTGNFSVDLTDQTFHIGRTNVDYSVTNNGTSSSVTYTLFARDGFWDPNFVAEKTLGIVFDKYKPDGKGPNLETPGGTPYDYKTRERTFFFKSVEVKK